MWVFEHDLVPLQVPTNATTETPSTSEVPPTTEMPATTEVPAARDSVLNDTTARLLQAIDGDTSLALLKRLNEDSNSTNSNSTESIGDQTDRERMEKTLPLIALPAALQSLDGNTTTVLISKPATNESVKEDSKRSTESLLPPDSTQPHSASNPDRSH